MAKEIPITTSETGPVRISPNAKRELAQLTNLAYGDLVANLRTVSTLVPEIFTPEPQFWSLLGRPTQVTLNFRDDRLGPEFTYFEAETLAADRNIPPVSPFMSAGSNLTADRANYELTTYTRPLYLPDRPGSVSALNRASLLFAISAIPHEFGHFLDALLGDSVARSLGLSNFWSHGWLSPMLLSEGFADTLSYAEMLVIRAGDHQKVLMQPGLAHAVRYRNSAALYPSETKLGPEIFDQHFVRPDRNDPRNPDYLVLNRSKRFLAFLTILGSRVGLPPAQLFELLQTSPAYEISLDSPQAYHPSELTHEIAESDVKYPELLTREAMLVMIEAVRFYYTHYPELVQTAVMLWKKDQAAASRASALNTTLFTHLGLPPAELYNQTNRLLELILLDDHVARVAEGVGSSIGRIASPASVHERPDCNPFLPTLIRARTPSYAPWHYT